MTGIPSSSMALFASEKWLKVMKVTGMELPLGIHQKYSVHVVPLGHEWRWKFPPEWVVWAGSPPADWQDGLGTGDIWFLGSRAHGGWGWGQLVVKPSAVRERTDGGPNVTQRCTVIYVHSIWRHKQLYLKLCCNYCQFKVAIFATVFLVSLILCFGLGDWSRICRAARS